MPIFLLALLGGLANAAANIVGRVLIGLFIGYVTYKGLTPLLTSIQDRIFALFANSYQPINAALYMLNIGKCINVTFSAILARNILDGLKNGSVTKQVIK